MTKKQKQNKIKKQLFDVLNDKNIYSPESTKL